MQGPNDTVSYRYSTADREGDPLRYAYAPFEGAEFFRSWQNDRARVLEMFAAGEAPAPANPVPPDLESGFETRGALEWLWQQLLGDPAALGSALDLLDLLRRRFERHLKLYQNYGPMGRVGDSEIWDDMSGLLRLGECFAQSCLRSRDLSVLNAQLKLIDTLIASLPRLDAAQGRRLAALIELERGVVSSLMSDLDERSVQLTELPRTSEKPHRVRHLDGVAFLAAETSRSQAYAQAMHEAGLMPEHVIIYGPERGGLLGQGRPVLDERTASAPVFLPDLDEALEATGRRARWSVTRVADGDINHPALLARLKETRPRVIVFSGFGGQIVGRDLLQIAPVLHAHAGWLPDYRGSTTLYYSWLNDDRCAVTVFCLEARLDAGPILLRRVFPPPPAGIDVDYHYDGAIRAAALVEVLEVLAETGALPPAEHQDKGSGKLYFIIHPLLKHIALLHQSRIPPST